MKLKLIWAQTTDGVIGVDGHLPWGRIPEDMNRFHELTLGCVVIMGRKTWASLPVEHRPLKGRFNIIVTSNPYAMPQPNAFRCAGITSALDLAKDAIKRHHLSETVWVIGGTEIFSQVLSLYDVHEVHVTHVPVACPDANKKVMAPSLGNFQEVQTEYVEGSVGLLKFSVYRHMLSESKPPQPPSLKSAVASLSFLYDLIRAEGELNNEVVTATSTALSLNTSGASAVVTCGQMDVLVETLTTLVESETPMKFDPATGSPDCTPNTPTAYRKYHGRVAWLFNPWTGHPRDARDIGSDTFGQLITP